MQENTQQSRVMIILKKIWPFLSKVINAIVYFLAQLIKGFFKTALQMVKGG
jgi:hypothetical protein